MKNDNPRFLRMWTRRRSMTALGLLAAPLAIGAWAGCSTSSSSSGLQKPDPGGTFGAEVNVHVLGAGRVVSNPEAVDCPGSADQCFHRFMFDPNAKSDVTLTAEASADWKFTGWSFNTTTAPTRGKGPDSCQPFTRASAAAPGGTDLANPSLKVSPGSTPGTPPPNQTGLCASDVPLAYDITATFVYAPLPDAGHDTGPDVYDAGAVPSIFDPPQIGATGGPIFYYSSRLFWQWNYAGQSAISSGFTSGGSRTDLVSLGPGITAFNFGGSELVYQNSNGLFELTTPSGSPFTLAGAPTCNAVAADFSYAYCRSSTNVYRWPLSGLDAGAAPTMPYASGLLTGPDLGVDTSYLYYSSTSGTVSSVLLSTLNFLDGGTPTPNTVASGQSFPSGVTPYASAYAYWLTSNGSISYASRSGGGAVTALDTQTGLRLFTVASSYVWYVVQTSTALGQASIWRVSYLGGTPTLVHQGLTDIRGITSDGSYVYYTGGDGKVYRLYGF